MRIGPGTFREWREAAGYTQDALADLLGKTEKTVRSWEKATAVPQMSIRKRLSVVLDVPYEDIRAYVEYVKAEIAAAQERRRVLEGPPGASEDAAGGSPRGGTPGDASSQPPPPAIQR